MDSSCYSDLTVKQGQLKFCKDVSWNQISENFYSAILIKKIKYWAFITTIRWWVHGKLKVTFCADENNFHFFSPKYQALEIFFSNYLRWC